MSRKVILEGAAAREELTKGADYLARCVASTLGPYGQTWFLQKANKITNDGVSVAREIYLNQEIQNRGVIALREAALKTVEKVGDGTTTATILAQAIYKAASPFLESSTIQVGKKKGGELIKQIEQERLEITQKLIDSALTITTKDQLIQSATVSTGDDELGKLIGETQWDLGPDGIIIAEQTNDKVNSVEKVTGLRIDNGFAASLLINNPEKQTFEMDDAALILTSFTIKDPNLEPLKEILTELHKSGVEKLIIIARAWTEEAVKTCALYIEKSALKIYPMNAPYEDMTQRMKDIAAVTGAKFFDSDSTDLASIQTQDVGKIKKIIGRRFDSTITGYPTIESEVKITNRIDELKAQILGSESEFEKKNLNKRIAQLQNGFGIIKVGSTSDMERERLFDKCDDAVNAVRWAFKEGTVKGGGLALKEISDSLPDTYILKTPILAPYKQLMSLAPSDFIIEDWVRDPVAVVRVSLEQACAAASSFATAGGAICDENVKPLDEVLKARQ